jgi:hypothetical protein
MLLLSQMLVATRVHCAAVLPLLLDARLLAFLWATASILPRSAERLTHHDERTLDASIAVSRFTIVSSPHMKVISKMCMIYVTMALISRKAISFCVCIPVGQKLHE